MNADICAATNPETGAQCALPLGHADAQHVSERVNNVSIVWITPSSPVPMEADDARP